MTNASTDINVPFFWRTWCFLFEFMWRSETIKLKFHKCLSSYAMWYNYCYACITSKWSFYQLQRLLIPDSWGDTQGPALLWWRFIGQVPFVVMGVCYRETLVQVLQSVGSNSKSSLAIDYVSWIFGFYSKISLNC